MTCALIFTDGCAAPSAGTQTQIPNPATSYAVGDEFTYVCNPGFSYIGNTGDLTITCDSANTWSSGTPPDCTSKMVYHYLLMLNKANT